jgi:hypothetical protein
MDSNAMFHEQLLGLENVRAMEAGNRHGFVDDDRVLVKIKDFGKAPVTKFTGVRTFTGVGACVEDTMVFLVEAPVTDDAGKWLLDTV